MHFPPHDIREQLYVHDLQRILRSTHSLLSHHSPHIRSGRLLHILGLALLSAMADLQQLEGVALENDRPILPKPS
jgi:hypothetical protein